MKLKKNGDISSMLFLFSLLLVLSTGCTDLNNYLSVTDVKWEYGGYGTYYIVGTVKNNSSKQFSYVQVEFNLYDENGAQVGNTFANVNNLEPYGTWKFRAVVFEDNAKKARLKGVWGY